MARANRLKEDWRENLSEYWFDLLLAGCEIVIARGGSQDVVSEVIKDLIDPTLTYIDHVSISDSTRIVTLLRARSLDERLRGQALTPENLLGLPKIEKSDNASHVKALPGPYDEKREQTLRFFQSCVPSF